MLVQLRAKAPDAKVEALRGKHAAYEHTSLRVTGNATVFKPNGQRLLTLIRGALSEDAAVGSYPFLHGLRGYRTMNRGDFSAQPRFKKLKEDGTVSNTNHAAPVRSAVAGYFDRYPRIPYCRETAFSMERPEEWRSCFPMVQEVARLFETNVPERYAAQLAAAKKTHPAYVIPKTPFTTLTINNCVAGGYHTDAGDYEPGFGAMVVLRRGVYRGCDLVFPKYGVSVDMQDRDLILFDPHEVHGNVPYHDTVGEEGEDWERISVVLYFREKMLGCQSPAEELARAKQLRGELGLGEDALHDAEVE